MVIKRIEPLSCGKLAGLLYGMIGLVVGAIVSVALLAGRLGAGQTYGAFGAGFAGVAAIVVLPIIYGVLGFIGAIVVAWLYNLAAGFTGGIEIEVK